MFPPPPPLVIVSEAFEAPAGELALMENHEVFPVCDVIRSMTELVRGEEEAEEARAVGTYSDEAKSPGSEARESEMVELDEEAEDDSVSADASPSALSTVEESDVGSATQGCEVTGVRSSEVEVQAAGTYGEDVGASETPGMLDVEVWEENELNRESIQPAEDTRGGAGARSAAQDDGLSGASTPDIPPKSR